MILLANRQDHGIFAVFAITLLQARYLPGDRATLSTLTEFQSAPLSLHPRVVRDWWGI